MPHTQYEHLRMKFTLPSRTWAIVTDDSEIELSCPVEFDEIWQEDQMLSQLGKQGWQLAARHDSVSSFILYFKRQIG